MFKKLDKTSLSLKLPLIFVANIIIITTITLIGVFIQFHNNVISNYMKIADGITNLMMEEVNPNKIEYYEKFNYKSSEYNSIIERWEKLRDNYIDIKYMYIFKLHKDDDGKVRGDYVFDVDGIEDEPYVLDDEFAKDYKYMISGETRYHTVMTPDEGYLFSYAKQLRDDNGKYVATVGVDFSMSDVYRQDIGFVLRLFAILFLFLVALFVLDVYIISKTVTIPLSRMVECTNNISYDTKEHRLWNINLFKSLDIKSESEIGKIYNAFVYIINASTDALNKLEKAKKELTEKEDYINYLGKAVYIDDMTGVGNKAAFNAMKDEVNKSIENGDISYSVIVADVNNLKYINDTFGHDKGDIYIKGCCNILSDVCKKNPVYRIGGDEFAVILHGREIKLSGQYIAKLMIAYNTAYNNTSKEKWERYSMSVGMATFKNDNVIDNIFTRADEDMYRQKEKFREKYGKYR